MQICSLYWWGEGEQFCYFNQESVQICSLYWWGEGEQFCSLQESVQTCSLYWWENFYQESVQICSLYWWGELLSGKCANLFTLLVGELLSGKCANLFTLLVGRTSIRKVCKLVHFTGGENFYQESVQICSLYWWGEGEQFCSLLSGKCANLFTLLVGRR